MLIKRDNIVKIVELFDKFSDNNFNIETQYKFIKLGKSLEEELDIYKKQLSQLQDSFERDENGEFIKLNDGGYKIIPDKLEDCYKLLNEINKIKVQVPDIYFTLEELADIGFTLKELKLLEPFIKD